MEFQIMKKSVQDLAVQSYCLRGFKNNGDVIEKVKECGLKSIELCGIHADFSNEESFDGIIELYRKAGIRIVSIGVQPFRNKAELEEKFFIFARKAGASIISADFSPEPESFRTAEKLADKYDINLAIHNHGGRHWLGSAQMLETVFAKTNSRIGLMLDTAWALDAGEDPLVMAERFSERLYGLHLKDFIFDSARKHQDVAIGEGNLKLHELMLKLKKDFKGCYILEYEGDVNNPVPALTKCVEAFGKEL